MQAVAGAVDLSGEREAVGTSIALGGQDSSFSIAGIPAKRVTLDSRFVGCGHMGG